KSTMLTQTAQINSLKDMIEKDKQIVEKRKSIKETASAQLANGSITTTDYLTQLNAEMQAELNQKVHEIKLMNAITNYNSTKGINNF
ncbi:MAG: TolC family protein, partial [Bacteroidia bacterium]